MQLFQLIPGAGQELCAALGVGLGGFGFFQLPGGPVPGGRGAVPLGGQLFAGGFGLCQGFFGCLLLGGGRLGGGEGFFSGGPQVFQGVGVQGLPAALGRGRVMGSPADGAGGAFRQMLGQL